MKPEVRAQLEKLNDSYPFRPFELETLDGRRVRVTRPLRRLYGEDKGGDLMTSDDSIQVLSYAELKDVILFIPGWKYPLRWLYERPHLAAAPIMILFFLAVIGGTLLATRSSDSRLPSASESRGDGRVAKPLNTVTETVNGNTVTTMRSGDFFTRIIKTPDGQSFLEEGYVNVWGEYHVTDVAGAHK
jgi:hypothetical protein